MKKLITAFSALLIVSIGFWACRKQDFKTDDLQIASKELQTWLVANGGIYKKGEISIKNSKGKLTKASLNWAETKHTNTLNNDFYEVPFVYTANNSSNTTVLTENEATLPICSIIFQKALNGSVVANVKLSLQASDVLTKAYKTSQYYKMDMFNDINGNRQAYYIWQRATDIKPKRVYPQKNKVDSSNTNLSTFSNSGGIKTVLEDNCMYFVSNNYATDCWADGGEANGTTCATVVVSVTLTSFCFSDGGGGNDYPGFDYGEYYNTQNDNNTQNTNKKIITVDTSITNNQKVNCVYEKLKSTVLDDILSGFLGNKYNVKIVVKTLDEGINGQTTNIFGSNDFEIAISRKNALDPEHSRIWLAKTIIHEAFHAKLKQKALEILGTTEIEKWPKNIDDMTLQELSNYFYSTANSLKVWNTVGHEWMINNIETCAGYLRTFVQQAYPAEYLLAGTDIKNYVALFYGGLQGVPCFESDILSRGLRVDCSDADCVDYIVNRYFINYDCPQ